MYTKRLLLGAADGVSGGPVDKVGLVDVVVTTDLTAVLAAK